MTKQEAADLRRGDLVKHGRSVAVVSGFWRDTVIFRTEAGMPFGDTLIKGVSDLSRWHLVRR